MKRVDAREVLWLVAALLVSVVVVLASASRAAEVERREAHARRANRRAIVDATGFSVAPREFRRVASGSILADRILFDLAEPERIVGLSRYGDSASAWEYQYGSRPSIDPNGNLEALVQLRPELLLVNNFVDQGRVARLREAGIVVFDLGEMHGLDTLDEDVTCIARLLGVPERGERVLRRFHERLERVAIDVPRSERKRGMYLGVHGTQLFGGARGTSYHDVVEAAGLVDAAAARYRGWPAMTSEDILAIDPDVIVSPLGQARGICRHVGLSALRACRAPHGIVEVDGALLVEPGLTILEAAEAVRDVVHGPTRRAAP